MTLFRLSTIIATDLAAIAVFGPTYVILDGVYRVARYFNARSSSRSG